MAEWENLRVRVPADINAKLTDFSESRRISKQDVIEAMLSWLLLQDELVQAMILGQIRPTAKLRRIAIDSLGLSTDQKDDEYEEILQMPRDDDFLKAERARAERERAGDTGLSFTVRGGDPPSRRVEILIGEEYAHALDAGLANLKQVSDVRFFSARPFGERSVLFRVFLHNPTDNEAAIKLAQHALSFSNLSGTLKPTSKVSTPVTHTLPVPAVGPLGTAPLIAARTKPPSGTRTPKKK